MQGEGENQGPRIFELDITEIQPNAVSDLLRGEIFRETASFTKSVVSHLDFIEGIFVMMMVSKEVFSDPAFKPPFTEPETDWQELRTNFGRNIKAWKKILYETVFLRAYQSFESYILNTQTCIYYLFPRFLTASPDDNRIGHVSFTDLYGASSVLQARRTLIENRAIAELQSKNIKEAIRSIENKFGVEFGIDLEDLKLLLQYSADRNILVHNHGIVNESYLTLLRRNKITPPHSLGAKISVDHDYTSNSLQLQRRIVQQIREALLAQAEQLLRYYEGKFGIYP